MLLRIRRSIVVHFVHFVLNTPIKEQAVEITADSKCLQCRGSIDRVETVLLRNLLQRLELSA